MIVRVAGCVMACRLTVALQGDHGRLSRRGKNHVAILKAIINTTAAQTWEAPWILHANSAEQREMVIVAASGREKASRCLAPAGATHIKKCELIIIDQ